MKIVKKIVSFFQETLEELKKASWPKRQELVSSTFIVIGAVFLLGFYVSIVDFSLYQVVRLLFSMVRS